MDLSNEDFWCILILFGKNTSTSKMALGKCLLSYASANKERMSFDELSKDFYDLYVDRVNAGKPQGGVLGKKTYVEQEIFKVLHAGKREELALEVVKDKSLKEIVLQIRLNRQNILQLHLKPHLLQNTESSGFISPQFPQDLELS